LNIGLALPKIPALMNSWVNNMNGKNYEKKKEEYLQMKLHET
jgi:hypothetical protein